MPLLYSLSLRTRNHLPIPIPAVGIDIRQLHLNVREPHRNGPILMGIAYIQMGFAYMCVAVEQGNVASGLFNRRWEISARCNSSLDQL